MSIPFIDRSFPVSPAKLLPQLTPDSDVFWNGLREGKLRTQICEQCERQRWPIVPVCPHCGSIKFGWKAVPDHGDVFSFIRYRRSYLPEFEDLMPYVVATVRLTDDVRMYGRLVEGKTPVRIGSKVEAIIERWPDDWLVPAFRITESSK